VEKKNLIVSQKREREKIKIYPSFEKKKKKKKKKNKKKKEKKIRRENCRLVFTPFGAKRELVSQEWVTKTGKKPALKKFWERTGPWLKLSRTKKG